MSPLHSLAVMPTDNRHGQFGGGPFFFMNASKVEITGKLGHSTFQVEPGAVTFVRPEAGLRQPGGLDFAKLEFHFRSLKDARPFFSSRWPVNPKARSMVFFDHDLHHERLRFHTIRNFIP